MKESTASGRWAGMLVACFLAGSAGRATAAAVRPLGGATLRIAVGLKDEVPTAWDGRIELSRGRVLSLAAEPPRGAKLAAGSWKLGTRKGGRRKKGLLRPVLTVAVNGPPAAKVSVTTKQGDFSFVLEDLPLGEPRTFLAGQVRVTRLPLSTRLTREPTDDDFPAAAAGPNGTVWVAYTAYRRGPAVDAAAVHAERKFDQLVPKGNGDQVRLLRFDGERWSAPIRVTEGGLDVFRPAVAVDGKGAVWVVWSQNVGGNWDLYLRQYDPEAGRWAEARRLTTAPGADVYAVAQTDPGTGGVSVVWQGWREGGFDILWRSVGEGARESRLSRTAANDWCPSAAFDSQGDLHVAYDTYEKGNYDVRLASVSSRGDVKTIEVAATPYFEARPSVAVDGKDRVWVAYELGVANWGKDHGTKWPGRKTQRLYLWREVVVRCIEGERIRQPKGRIPAEPVAASYPRGLDPPRRRIALARLALDGAGRPWLLYRRHPAKGGSGERWVSFATCHAGGGWMPAVPLVHSVNLLDNRPALVALEEGGLLAIHSTDGRTGGSRSAAQNDLYCSVLPPPRAAEPPVLVSVTASPAPLSDLRPVHPYEGEDVRRIRAYRAKVAGKTYQLLRGEFHRHTELTAHQDMDGTLEEMWRYALDAAAFDWIGNGDHDNGYGVEYLWWLVQKQTDLFHHAPAFNPMFTYERSRSYPSGHRNAMFAQRGIRPMPQIPGGRDQVMGTPEGGSPDIKGFYAYLKHFGGICASHTSGTNMGTDWRDNDPEVEPIVEIFQGCRQSYEHLGAPATAKDAKDSVGGYRPDGFVWNALRKGYRLGFESSSDHYSTHISYAVVYAEEPTRRGILAAFKKRHSYAANDNIILDVRCGEHMMGDVFTARGKPTIEVRAFGTQPIARLSIIRGAGKGVPRYVYDTEPDRQRVRLAWTDQSPIAGQTSYYYVRVEQERPEGGAGALAWASPMWITLKE